MWRIKKQHRGRFYLLCLLTFVVCVAGAIVWLETRRLPEFGPPVTEDERARREASLQLRSPRLSQERNVSPSKSTNSESITKPAAEPVEVEFNDPGLYWRERAQRGRKNLSLMERKILRSRGRYGAVLASRETGVNEEIFNQYLDQVERELERFAAGHIEVDYAAGEDSFRWNTLYWIYELAANAQPDILAKAQERLRTIARRMPLASDVGRAVLRRYDEDPPETPEVFRQVGDEPQEDGLGVWLRWVYERRKAQKRLVRSLEAASEEQAVMLAYLDAPWDPDAQYALENFDKAARALSLPEGDTIKLRHFAWQRWFRAADTVLALERFRHEEGAYPERLTELTPRFIPDIAPDAQTGEPLDYFRHPDGYTLTQTRQFYVQKAIAVGSDNLIFSTSAKIGQWQLQQANGTSTVASPLKESWVPAWQFAGPMPPETAPTPEAVLEAAPSMEAFESVCGMPVRIVHPDSNGVLYMGERFTVPRDNIFYLRTVLHAENVDWFCLRHNSVAPIFSWFKALDNEDEVRTDRDPYRIDRPGLSVDSNSGWSSAKLADGRTILLLRVEATTGEAAVSVAIQDKEGKLPAGIRFE